jgi:hypothetical protein
MLQEYVLILGCLCPEQVTARGTMHDEAVQALLSQIGGAVGLGLQTSGVKENSQTQAMLRRGSLQQAELTLACKITAN